MSVEIQTMGEGGIFEIAAVVIDEVLEIQPFTDVEYEILSSARDILAEGSILEAATVATNSANTAAGLASEAASAANDAAGLANSATTSANTAAGAANSAASSANSAASAANTAAATAASFVGTGPAGYYATLTALQAAYPEGDTGIYVELEYGHWYYWSGIAWTDGGLFQTPLAVVQTTGTSTSDVMSQKAVTDEIDQLAGEVSQKASHGYVSNPKTLKEVEDNASVKIENLVVNGDFSSGANGWVILANTATISDKLIFNGVASANNGVHTEVPSSINNKLYLKFKTTNEGETFPVVRIYNYDTFDAGGSLSVDIETASTIFNSLLGGVRLYFRQSSGLTYINATIDDVMVIDLTATFGAGNEPTKEEMDLLISTLGIDYFEGEITIPAQKVMQWQLALIRKNKNAIIAFGGTII